jgi:hypothetical protein
MDDRRERASVATQMEFEDKASLRERWEEPLRRALEDRAAFYRVSIYAAGRCGEVMVSITGSKGRLPLLFDRDMEMEPGYVLRLVRDTVDRFAF